jgi:hypothetical protein
MEPKRAPGDDRIMWKATSPSGDSCICETRGDAYEAAGSDEEERRGFRITSILMTAEEWNELPEFDGW